MNDHVLDFDLGHPRMRLWPAVDESTVLQIEKQLGLRLPPSYRWWLRQVAGRANFDIGNCLWLYPLEPEAGSASVITATRMMREWDLCDLKELVVFGAAGVDGELWAFYSGARDLHGELPILWITPGSMGGAPYVLCNTTFARFLNIQVQYLLRSDEEPLLTLEEASDPARVAIGEENDRNAWIELYRRYDPAIAMTTNRLYDIAVTAPELRRDAARAACATMEQRQAEHEGNSREPKK